jgi:hypothetical protein
VLTGKRETVKVKGRVEPIEVLEVVGLQEPARPGH